MRRHIYPRSSPILTTELHASATDATPTRLVLLLALEADCDPRSARRALEEGARAVRGRVGERLALAAKKLGITLPGSAA